MKTLIKIAKSFKNTELPIIQKNIVNRIDGSIESIITADKLHLALNVCFSYHYFFVSGTTPENTVTTKHTDGSCAAYGSQSKIAENNANDLSLILKAILKPIATNMFGDPLNKELNEKAFFNGKRIIGATRKNIYK